MTNPHIWDQYHHEDGSHIAWCGAKLHQGIDWYFLGANHAALSVKRGMTTQPCKECVKTIIKELSKSLTPSELEEIAWITEEKDT